VPMFGFGLNGLWAAYHADFPRRPVDPSPPNPPSRHERTSVPE
jgi:hypothetical protein